MIRVTVSDEACIQLQSETNPTEISTGHVHFKRSHKLDLTDAYSEFIYLWIDVSKFDEIWKISAPDRYIPADLNDLLNFNILGEMYHREQQLNKSENKVFKLLEIYQQINAIEIDTPVLKTRAIDFEEGRHRFWLCRHLGLTHFLATVNGYQYRQLVNAGVAEQHSRSRVAFDRNHNPLFQTKRT
ncbi:hypothetical protein VCSRO82_3001 [Vibrio cholerae]|uniref:hypothetical protein n=1 Tax=Vibrio cholerae TaxID=666 RepID=UPI0011D55FA5|nr:hypothetical protein [Vibrio cholerae]TXZ37797.1 hypothetical protein FXE69_00245 [Vibrio cholerae]GHZ89963.1 hypothetical protein VCSRO82_3001 [Vibrio cholerae]